MHKIRQIVIKSKGKLKIFKEIRYFKIIITFGCLSHIFLHIMPTLRLTKEFRFEGAHALTGYDGKCRHIHGHSYILYVTVKGTPSNPDGTPKSGMLIDFTDLKKIVNDGIIDRFDHALILRDTSPIAREIADAYSRVIIVPFQPTCENLVLYFAETIKKALPQGVSLHSLRLHETATSYVEWFESDNG